MIIKCKMCGGDMELNAEKTFGTCEYCGSAMTLPKLSDEQRLAAFNRGNHFRRLGEFDKALAVYERIVQEDDTDAEAHWCCALCRFGIEYVEDPATYEWLPTCHRASFDSFLEDVDYKAALEYSDGITRRQYMKDAAKIAEVQRGILATSQNAEPYDVFICYKETDENGQRTRDSLLAQDIYYQLTEQGRRVFFARITLEDVAGSQYEPYIFAALNSAKVMVAVGTKPEHFNAVWVKNEWSRFLAMMKKDHSKLLLPCYRDMDPYDLPEQLSVLQSYDMSKIGFIQDLIRGVGKVLDAEKKAAPTVAPTETVVVQQNSNVTALLKRGAMALEDGDWARADEFYEEVLNQDAECAEAYLGKVLAAERCSTIDAFVRKRKDAAANARSETKELKADKARVAAAVEKYALPGFLEEKTIRNRYDFDLSYPSAVAARRAQVEAERRFWAEHKLLSRAEKFAAGAVAENLKREKDALFAALVDRVKKAEAEEAAAIAELKKNYDEHLDKADKTAEALYNDALNRREEHYQALCAQLKQEENLETLRELKAKLEALNGYSDSAAMIKRCEEKIQKIEAELAAEAERQRILAAEEAERQRILAAKQAAEQARKNKRNCILLIIGFIAAVVLYITFAKTTDARSADAAIDKLAEESITLESLDRIVEVEETVAALSEREIKSLDSLELLHSMRAEYDSLVEQTAKHIEQEIEKLPALENIKLASEDQIKEVAKSYARTTEAVREKVSNAEDLFAAEERMETVKKNAWVECTSCGGDGRVTCDRCKGEGSTLVYQKSPNGKISLVSQDCSTTKTCRTCGGEGGEYIEK